jgi:hypothetical protein
VAVTLTRISEYPEMYPEVDPRQCRWRKPASPAAAL